MTNSASRSCRESPRPVARLAKVAGVAVSKVTEKDGVKYVFDSEGWLLHRLSCTEPMVRLYCEHREEEKVASILDEAEERLRSFAKT